MHRIAILSLFLLLSTGCDGAGDILPLADAQARWKAHDLTSYTIKQSSDSGEIQFSARVVVRNNTVVDLIDARSHREPITDDLEAWKSSFRTVDEMFAWIAARQGEDPYRLTVEYDEHMAFQPESVW